MRRLTMNGLYWAGLVFLGFVLALVVLQVGLGRPGPTGVAQLANHDSDPCWDYGDCGDGRGGYDERNGGGSGDGRGGDGRFGGGRSGDYDGGPGDDCRNACGNTIVIPDPRGR